MKSYYLEDKIKETHGTLRVKVLKLVYADAVNKLNKEIGSKSGNSMLSNNPINSFIFDIYGVPTSSIFIKISFASSSALEILRRELEETFRPYKEIGLDSFMDEQFEHFLDVGVGPYPTYTDDKLCTDFNKEIEEICDTIIASIADARNSYYDNLKREQDRR